MSSDHVVNVIYSSFLHVIFLTYICEITYVPRWSRTDDIWVICCLLTQHFTVPGKITGMHCYLYINFIFKFALIFLNSEHNYMLYNNTLYYTSPDIVHMF